MRDPTRQSMRSTRRAPREDATNAHAFPRVRTHAHERIHPSRASFARLHPRVASHRIASRPSPSPRVTAAIQPPPVAPARRHPTTDDPSADVRADASKKHIEPTFRARTTHRSPRATRRGRRHGRRRRRHRPHHHRPRPRRRRVTSRRHARDRAIDGCSIGFVFWILIGFGVCTLRTCRVVYS